MTHLFLAGILGTTAIVSCWVMAGWLFRVGSSGSMARRLSILLLAESLVLATAGFPEFVLSPVFDAERFYQENQILGIISFQLHHLADGVMIWLYPPLLASALQIPITQPFARKKVQRGMAAAALVLAVIPTLSYAIWESSIGQTILYIAVSALFLFAMVASIRAWRVAPLGLVRDRALLFAIAFGIRDLCWVFTYAASAYLTYHNAYTLEEGSLGLWIKVIYALGTMLSVPLIAYGILRGHLFDIDLRIRWTIKHSTLAGMILAFIFLISEGVSEFLSAELGTVAGLLAAAVVIFFLTPLQQFAERVAARAMPDTQNTPEYKAFRKMQVYESALLEALEEGGISARERKLLDTLYASLEITPADAKAIEEALRARLESAGQAPAPS